MTPRELALAPIAGLFAGLVALRNQLYDRGILRQDSLDAPVISIGNLSMGGTGKSPIVADLANRYSREGKRVAVLSRGYGRLEPKSCREVTRDGDWRFFGDEPAMIALEAPDARVYVGPSRLAAAQLARDWRPDLYLIDDGFQHRALRRDLDLVLLDLSQGPPRIFPLGLFREGWSGIKRADLLLLTRWDGKNTPTWVRRAEAIRPELTPTRVQFLPDGMHQLNGKPFCEPAEMVDMPLAAYAGIAQPEKFFDSLTNLGAHLVAKLPLRDHENPSLQRLKDFATHAKQRGACAIVTTAKDAVKLANSPDFGIVFTFLKLKVAWEASDPTHRFSAFLKAKVTIE